MSATEDPLYRDPDLAAFYDLDNGWRPDLDFCARPAADATSALHLGCGTGALLATMIAAARTAIGR